MSVLIKGMEIPKNERYVDVRIFADGRAITATGERPFYREMDVIELPPHGRLIDADALEDRCRRQARDEWNKSTGTNWGYAYATFESDVEDAPTILEAEDGEE